MAEKDGIVNITVEFDTKNGAVSINSNTSNQMLQLGMLTFAVGQINKPKESAIQKPDIIDLARHSK